MMHGYAYLPTSQAGPRGRNRFVTSEANRQHLKRTGQTMDESWVATALFYYFPVC